MGRKRKTRMTKNGKAPALLNRQCTSLVLLPGVTKTSPQQLHKWPTRSHTPPWTNMFLQERSISNSLASDQRPDPCTSAAAAAAAPVPLQDASPTKSTQTPSTEFTKFRNLRQSKVGLGCVRSPCLKLEEAQTPNFVLRVLVECQSVKGH